MLGGERKVIALEDSSCSRIATRSIVRSEGVSLLSAGFTRNPRFSRQRMKRKVLYPNTIMEEGGPSMGAFNNTIEKHLMKFCSDDGKLLDPSNIPLCQLIGMQVV